MFSSTIDATLGVFDESDVLAWPLFPAAPPTYTVTHAHARHRWRGGDHSSVSVSPLENEAQAKAYGKKPTRLGSLSTKFATN